MDGILNIHKPQGLTSFGVVARVKRLAQENHAGHSGTLDPLATGVLPVGLGQATRVIEFLFNETKTYRTQIELGVTTDTFDSTGKILRTRDASGITREMVETVLEHFRGSILQTPPMFSAVKHQGKPLYKLARSGIEVERKARPAQIHSLELTDWQSPLMALDIVCGRGTYIRSLAQDIGEELGCGAHMKSLIRLRVGPFNIEDALTLPQLEEIAQTGTWGKYLYPVDYALQSFDALIVSHEQQCSLVHGAPISPAVKVEASPIKDGALSRVYSADGSFVGMVKYDAENSLWRAEKIFLKQCCQQSE
jgi:tRNA pseudouridine55 synthase